MELAVARSFGKRDVNMNIVNRYVPKLNQSVKPLVGPCTFFFLMFGNLGNQAEKYLLTSNRLNLGPFPNSLPYLSIG